MLDELDTATQQYTQSESEPSVNPTEQIVEPPAQQDSQKEQNFRLLRERAEAAERKSQELERMIQMNMSQNQQSTKLQVVEDDDDIDIPDDTYIEGKHLKKYVKNLKKELKDTKREIREATERTATSQAEFRLKSEYSDFDKIVTKENLEKLQHLKPSLYRSLVANPDIYDRGCTAYDMIKYSPLFDKQEYQQIDQKMEDNRSKPRSAGSAAAGQTGDTPLARVGDYDRRVLTEERKSQLRRQVEEAKRNKV